MIAIDNIAKLALLPVLVVQALMAKRGAQSLPEPPGPRSGTDGAGPPLRILIVGDSSGAGVGAAHQDEALSGRLRDILAEDHKVTWRLEARTGATTASTLETLHDVPHDCYDVAVVALGVNDVTSGVTGRRLLAQRAALHRMLREDFGAARLVVSGMPPLGNFPLLPNPLRWVLGRTARRFDARLASQTGVEYIRFDLPFDARMMASDGFHPGPPAYRVWAEHLAREILK
ncbi:SGNH/GDSL hydrolase family protein [Aliiroseovarius subalbicans]|uniref:SGNH/GDSL hydrolase family protein n=1 Tax=Aliiroseovarius subalbicans TaxID=2925840 RepID=UPI001F55B63A|nr:SGNH/GDSL hydrolase family protein [Aliiroseovarius subalbicans]MCI2400516.1 SGNH/GDSL hydrolase family protein [Aliiroseovarius subalbicans]